MNTFKFFMSSINIDTGLYETVISGFNSVFESDATPNLPIDEPLDDKLPGGNADNMSLKDMAQRHDIDIHKLIDQLLMGLKIEMEHTDNPLISMEIAMDHLYEIPDYYTRLISMEDLADKQGLRKE